MPPDPIVPPDPIDISRQITLARVLPGSGHIKLDIHPCIRVGTKWDALAAAAAKVAPSGCWTLDPAPLFDDPLVTALRAEFADDTSDKPLLRSLATSEAVHAAASHAAGCVLRSSGYATYMVDEPGPTPPVHVDRDEYPWVLHVVIEHTRPEGGVGSRLVTYHADGPRFHSAGVGDGVLLAGGGTLHEWEPLGPTEHRTMIAIGLAL